MYVKLKWLLFFIPITILATNCKHNEWKNLEHEIRTTTITVPTDSFEVLKPERQTQAYLQAIDSPNLRYVVYIDSLQCASCRMHKMNIWRSIMQYTHTVGARVDFCFIFRPKNKSVAEFRHEYYAQKIQMRFFLDTTGVMERHNPLLAKSSIFHAFVLNDSNHIEVIGDASKSELVERKYYEFLHKKKAERNAP